MATTIYFENQRGEHYKVTLDDHAPAIIDNLLDQLNAIPAKYITADQFRLEDPMTIDIYDPGMKNKIGQLECENVFTDELYSKTNDDNYSRDGNDVQRRSFLPGT